MTAIPSAIAELPDLGAPLDLSIDSLKESEKEKLSKSLFPETHTEKVKILGVERTFRPIPIKQCRYVNKLLEPLMTKVEEAQKTENAVQVDEETISALKDVAECLCKYYGSEWDDIYKAIKEEEIPQSDLEAIAYTQQNLNGVNDFLLRPLRALVRMLQVREIATVKLESMLSSSISLPS